MKPTARYCVMTYNGTIVYQGRSIDKASTWMDPGTVCGVGENEDEARWDATRQIGNLGKPEPSKAI